MVPAGTVHVGRGGGATPLDEPTLHRGRKAVCCVAVDAAVAGVGVCQGCATSIASETGCRSLVKLFQTDSIAVSSLEYDIRQFDCNSLQLLRSLVWVPNRFCFQAQSSAQRQMHVTMRVKSNLPQSRERVGWRSIAANW